jgi:hypothetical protein
LALKVSDIGSNLVYFLIGTFPVCSFTTFQDGYMHCFFIAPIDQEISLFMHSAMAGGKSKDGGSVPKKGSR